MLVSVLSSNKLDVNVRDSNIRGGVIVMVRSQSPGHSLPDLALPA